MSLLAFTVATEILEHLHKKRFVPLTKQIHTFENVTLVLLKNRRGNPRLIGYSDCVKRYGVIPIFYSDQGIIVPLKCKIQFKPKQHFYNSPFSYYVSTIQRALTNFFKDDPYKVAEALIHGHPLHISQEPDSKDITETSLISTTVIKEPIINLIPFFSENFGHELCQLLSLQEEYLAKTSHEDTSTEFTQSITYCSYPHLVQANEFFSNLQNLTPIVIDKFNHVYQFTKIRFIPTRMRAFPDATLKPAIDYLLNHLPTIQNDQITNLAMIKTHKSRLFAVNGSPKNKVPAGSFVPEIESYINNHTPFRVIDHEKLSLIEVLNYLKHAKCILLSWGAMAYWGMFLDQKTQPCLVIVNKHYKGERNVFKNRVCFDDELYNNYHISRPMPKDINKEGLTKWINTIYQEL